VLGTGDDEARETAGRCTVGWVEDLLCSSPVMGNIVTGISDLPSNRIPVGCSLDTIPDFIATRTKLGCTLSIR